MPFTLAYDSTRAVLRVAFDGEVTRADHQAMVAAVRRFIEATGPVHAIADFSAVAKFDLDFAYLRALARVPAVLAGRKRAIVAPTDEIFGAMRLFEQHQSATGDAPVIVRTLQEAYDHLGLVAPDFKAI